MTMTLTYTQPSLQSGLASSGLELLSSSKLKNANKVNKNRDKPVSCTINHLDSVRERLGVSYEWCKIKSYFGGFQILFNDYMVGYKQKGRMYLYVPEPLIPEYERIIVDLGFISDPIAVKSQARPTNFNRLGLVRYSSKTVSDSDLGEFLHNYRKVFLTHVCQPHDVPIYSLPLLTKGICQDLKSLGITHLSNLKSADLNKLFSDLRVLKPTLGVKLLFRLYASREGVFLPHLTEEVKSLLKSDFNQYAHRHNLQGITFNGT